MHREDTIAAIATAPGEAGISIVRVSGPEALAVADRIFEGPGPRPSERAGMTFAHGHIRNAAGHVDEVLMLFMRRPASYTREDMIEIQGHGGVVSARRLLRAVIEAGARLAEPGEFTRRAFLNGRIDLTQAEAVLDLIRARSERAAAAALEQLDGGISRSIQVVYDDSLSIAADLEATLDFPDDGLPEAAMGRIVDRLGSALRRVRRLIETWDEGHLLREGALVVISGRPNVGKSTLLNALLERDRAIVSKLPGTTRDVIEESLALNGIPLRLVDTAGLRAATDDVEIEGVRRSHLQRQKADLHLYVLDGSAKLHEEDRAHLAALNPVHTLLVLNKTDLGVRVKAEDIAPLTGVRTSLLEDAGLDKLKAKMHRKLAPHGNARGRPHAVVSERHRRLLLETEREMDAALDLLSVGAEDQVVLAASRLRDALESLGLITGRTYTTDLLDSIFSRFCIGK